MVLLLIILLSIIIFALRATLYGLVAARIVHKAGKVTVKAGTKVAKSTKKAAKKAAGVTEKPKSKSGIRKGAEAALKATAKTGKTIIYGGTKIIVSSYEFTLALVIRLLRWLRGALITLFGLICLLDIVVFLILLLASAFYIMYLSDGAYTVNDKNNTKQESQQKKEEETEKGSNGEIDTSKIKTSTGFGENYKKLADEVIANWEKYGYKSKMTSERMKLIQSAINAVGVCNHYSQGLSSHKNKGRVCPWNEIPICTDCSGFTCWAFSTLTKGTQEDFGGNTWGIDSKTDMWQKGIAEKDLIPGDIGMYGSIGHVGIFFGKNKSGEIMFIHCTSTVRGYTGYQDGGVKINNGRGSSGNLSDIYYRYKKWKK